ncbi:hypothetical protein ASF62_12085 [Leifsonia sp. Leaf325]|nr:glycosyltransferase family 4 protein [Leifsonia sp. Leaf325]KQQ92583.1 hypothetical protein ASF62_12085 [Leifsonia sp. Leaf325]
MSVAVDFPPTRLRRIEVLHVGRRGEVAGGMTQVVNGYLSYPFDDCDLRVIVSRDGSTGPRAMAIFLGAAWRLATLRGRDERVVVVHLSQGGSFVREGLLLRLAHARGFGTVAHLHGSSFPDYAEREPARVATVLRAADSVFVLSAETRAAVLGVLPTAPTELIPNAVPEGVPRAKGRSIVFGGSVSLRKGVDVLVDAWRRIADHDGWTLHVVGPVADPEVVPAGLPDAVFHGGLPHAELMELLESAEIAVLPSRDEAMPMFILEALARQDCVVATRVGGIPAVLADGAGALVDAGDAAGLAEALERLMVSDAARDELRAAGTARFERDYSAAAVYPMVAARWRAVLRGSR